MNTLQILVSGDYWHDDFREQFSKLSVPATLVPVERIKSLENRAFQLIVLAQSRRDQISQSFVDLLRSEYPEVPIVVLQGSWCEGENRSGKPLLGVSQVLWHQWESRFERFCIQVNDGMASDWHLPLTASVSDRVRDFSPDPGITAKLIGKRVLVSSEDRTSFESISDMLGIYQSASVWAQTQQPSSSVVDVDVICVDANGMSSDLTDRISKLKSEFDSLPILVTLNFPRKQDLASLEALGVQEVVSKPYTHNEFLMSLIRALDESGPLGDSPSGESATIPKPQILGAKPAAKNK